MAFIKRKKTMHQSLRVSLSDPFLSGMASPCEDSSAQDQGVIGSPNGDIPLEERQDNQGLIGAPLFRQLSSCRFLELTLIFVMSAVFYNFFLGNMQDEAEAALVVSSRWGAESFQTSAN